MPTTTGLATSFITFSRPGASGGGATVTDRDGKIKWAGHNLLTNSESFDASAWSVTSGVTVTANSTNAPNSTTTADTLAFGTAGYHYQPVSIGSAITGSTYTAGVWLWSTTGKTQIVLRMHGQTTGTDQTLQTVTITSTPTLFTISRTFTSTDTAFNVGLDNRTVAGGDGVAGNVIAWGAYCHRADLGGMQLNPAQPAGMQSYYPTTVRNMVGYSEDFSNAYWTKLSTTATAVSVTNPAGLGAASLVYPASSGTDRLVYRSPAITAVTSTPYTFSVYAKSNGINFLYFGTFGGGTVASSCAFFDLQNGVRTQVGTAFTSATITAVGNGWYRCSATANPSSAQVFPVFGLADANNSGTVTANGTNGIYLWGAQLSDSASLDTYVPQYGAAVTSAAYYAPRLDFDGATLSPRGLLVEELRTNSLTYSSEFDNAAWLKYETNTTGTPAWVNVGTAPDGTATADKLIDTTTNDAHIIYRFETLTSAAYTFSVYAKAAERSILYLRLDNGGAKYAYFNLSTGAASNVNAAYTAAITPVGNGWYRCSITTTGTAASYTPVIGVTTTAGTPTYAGDGTSGVLIWGAQLELGSFATSYIPNGSAVAGATRTADVASVSTQAFPYSGTEGTIVANVDVFTVNNPVNANLYSLYTDGNNAIRSWIWQSARSTPLGTIRASGAEVGFSNGTVTANTAFKTALAYKTNDFGFALNGSAAASVTSGNVPAAFAEMGLGRQGTGEYLNGHIRQITYIPRRLSNTELAARSA